MSGLPVVPESVWVVPFRASPDKPVKLYAFASDEEAHEMRSEEQGACQDNELGEQVELWRASALEAEVARLRAALAAVLALEAHDVWDSDTCKDAFDIAEKALVMP